MEEAAGLSTDSRRSRDALGSIAKFTRLRIARDGSYQYSIQTPIPDPIVTMGNIGCVNCGRISVKPRISHLTYNIRTGNLHFTARSHFFIKDASAENDNRAYSLIPTYILFLTNCTECIVYNYGIYLSQIVIRYKNALSRAQFQ